MGSTDNAQPPRTPPPSYNLFSNPTANANTHELDDLEAQRPSSSTAARTSTPYTYPRMSTSGAASASNNRSGTVRGSGPARRTGSKYGSPDDEEPPTCVKVVCCTIPALVMAFLVVGVIIVACWAIVTRIKDAAKTGRMD